VVRFIQKHIHLDRKLQNIHDMLSNSCFFTLFYSLFKNDIIYNESQHLRKTIQFWLSGLSCFFFCFLSQAWKADLSLFAVLPLSFLLLGAGLESRFVAICCAPAVFFASGCRLGKPICRYLLCWKHEHNSQCLLCILG